MNLVASTLLLVHADEEDAFWNLTCIIEKHLPDDFFSPSLLVSRACPLVLLDYVHDLIPAVFDHLMNLGVDLPAICFSWFLSLFTDCLPVEVRTYTLCAFGLLCTHPFFRRSSAYGMYSSSMASTCCSASHCQSFASTKPNFSRQSLCPRCM